MDYNRISTQAMNYISTLGVASSAALGAYCSGSGQVGVGAAFGVTAYLVNKVVTSQFDKYVRIPERDFNNPIEAFSKLSVYGLSYAASKVAVLALTIASSYVVASALGLGAVASAVAKLAVSGSGLVTFTAVAYLSGVTKGAIFGEEETWDFSHMHSCFEGPRETDCRRERPFTSNFIEPSNNLFSGQNSQIFRAPYYQNGVFEFPVGFPTPLETPPNSRMEELRAESSPRNFAQNLEHAFHGGGFFPEPLH